MESRKQVCPLCGEGVLEVRHDRVHQFLAGRHRHTVTGLEHSVCSVCGSSICSDDQIDRNVARIEQYQSTLSNYISPEKIAELRARYNISQATAAKIFGGGPNAFSKYERGEISPSAAAASIMLLALESADIFRALATIKGVSLSIVQPPSSSASKALTGRTVGVCETVASVGRAYSGYLDYYQVEDSTVRGGAAVDVFFEKDVGRWYGSCYIARKTVRQSRGRAKGSTRQGYVGQQGFDKISGKKWHATTH